MYKLTQLNSVYLSLTKLLLIILLVINAVYMIWMNYIVEGIVLTIVVYGIYEVIINGTRRKYNKQMRTL